MAPKNIGQAELAAILRLIAWPPATVAKITGADLSADITDPDQIRCLRALARWRELRDVVSGLRMYFPDTTVERVL